MDGDKSFVLRTRVGRFLSWDTVSLIWSFVYSFLDNEWKKGKKEKGGQK